MRRIVALAFRMVMPAVVLLAQGSAPLQAADRNVVLLIADDFGIDVAGFYPTSARKPTTPPPPPTPNLAALARQGVLFTRAWANPWCSPTRATILAGRYGFRTGIGRANTSNLPPLSVNELSLPEAFAARSDLGYVVASFGKWHLSSGEDDPNLHGWPCYAGSHTDLGKLPSYFSWPKTVNGITTTSTTYATTDTVNEALGVIARAKSRNRPCFLWVAFNAPARPPRRRRSPTVQAGRRARSTRASTCRCWWRGRAWSARAGRSRRWSTRSTCSRPSSSSPGSTHGRSCLLEPGRTA